VFAFLFVDGLGLSADPRSPLRQLELPTLRALTGDFASVARDAPGVAYRALDANLGFEGLPQSGTGQTTLLTGTNASALLGHHQGPHPGRRLQGLLREQSLQVWAARRGLKVLHANGYRPEYLERLRASRRNLFSAFAFAAVAAGLELLPLDDPRALLPAFWPDPERSGERFAALALEHDLVILENWSLDYSAHREPERLSERFGELDRFVRGWLEAGLEATLLLTADHGNAEEPWHPSHTRNPVPLLVVGPKAATVPPMTSLLDVAPWVQGQF
jgi:2,3-bisphosphoglycerate-independent phosphoglycerate mutase